MNAYIEALLLYTIFLPGKLNRPEGPVLFTAKAELVILFMFTILVLTLIWYLLGRGKPVRDWGLKPCKKDLFSGLIAFPCLFIIGYSAAFAGTHFGALYDFKELFGAPKGAVEWMFLCISCISRAYLEESYFRFYLLSRRKELKLGAPAAVAVQAALFSFCHIYEGPWGLVSALLSGILLSLIFLRYNALHGIALAHGLYNITAFATAAITAI
jgi:membrane protease YdiL (CAAX protease family)